MKKGSIGFSVFALALGATFSSVAQGVSISNGLKHVPINAAYLSGTWKVTKVDVGSQSAVAALVDNDPAYMGAVASISADAIAWNASATDKKGTYDGCSKPGFAPSTHDRGSYAVTCGHAPWGFGATFKMIDQNTMLLNWYDNGVLMLTRQ